MGIASQQKQHLPQAQLTCVCYFKIQVAQEKERSTIQTQLTITISSIVLPLSMLFVTLLAWKVLTAPVSESDPPESSLSDRQLIAGAIVTSLYLAAAGFGIAAGVQIEKSIQAKKPTPGPSCIGSGSWTSVSVIVDLIPSSCANIVAHALDWEYYNDDTLRDPISINSQNLTGQPLFNEDGFRQQLWFGLYDADPTAQIYYTQDACEGAMRTIVQNCMGKHEDTRGGYYNYGVTGNVVTYLVDATCLDSPGKTCGSHT